MHRRSLLYPWLKIFVLILVGFTNRRASAQDAALKNSLSVYYTTLRFFPHQQYIGAGIQYRFMARSWIGGQIQISKFPQKQGLEDPVSGGPLIQTNASVLLGHRWGKFGIYGEAGGGILRANVFEGVSEQNLAQLFDVRYYPDCVIGGLLDVAVGRRWSLTFNVRDNMTFIGPYTASGPYGPLFFHSENINAPEGRAGVAFHF